MGYYTTRVHITLDTELLQQLDDLAMQHFASRSAILRWIILEHFKNQSANAQKADEELNNWYNS